MDRWKGLKDYLKKADCPGLDIDPEADITRICYCLSGWYCRAYESVSSGLMEQMMNELGYRGYFRDAWRYLKDNGHILGGAPRPNFWIAGEKCVRDCGYWLDNSPEWVEQDLGILHTDALGHRMRREYSTISEWRRAEILSVGTDVLLHYDEGEDEKLRGFFKRYPHASGMKNFIRNAYVTYWETPDNTGPDSNIPRYIWDSCTHRAIPMALSFNDITRSILDPSRLENLRVDLDENPNILLEHHPLREKIEEMVSFPRANLIVLVSAIPRSFLFMEYLVLNLFDTRRFRQSYLYTRPESYIYEDGKCSNALTFNPRNDLDARHGVFFMEHDPVRITSEGFQQFAKSCEKLTCLSPESEYYGKGRFAQKSHSIHNVDENFLKDLTGFEVTEGLRKVDYLSADSTYHMLRDIRPTSIFVSGNRVTCLGVAAYFGDILKTFVRGHSSLDEMPEVTFVHVAASKYSDGFEGAIHPVFEVEPYEVQQSYA